MQNLRKKEQKYYPTNLDHLHDTIQDNAAWEL